MRRLATLFAVATACSLFAAHARAEDKPCWEYESALFSPDDPAPSTCDCSSWMGGSSTSFADTISTAHQADGQGVALDAGPGFCEAFVRTSTAEGSFSEHWSNPCVKGWVLFEAEVKVEGRAELLNAACAAAALGYAQVDSSITGVTRAEITESQGETTGGALGGVGWGSGGLGANVAVPSPGQGLGIHSDKSMKHKQGSSCADTLDYTIRSRAFIKVWANATAGQASCLTDMLATAGVQFLLDVCTTE